MTMPCEIGARRLTRVMLALFIVLCAVALGMGLTKQALCFAAFALALGVLALMRLAFPPLVRLGPGLTAAQLLVEVAGRYHYSIIPMLLPMGQYTWVGPIKEKEGTRNAGHPLRCGPVL